MLVLNKLERLLTVCKVKNIDDIDFSKEFYFIGKTDEEISLVCETDDVPENTIEREDGGRGFPYSRNFGFFTHWHSFKIVWNTSR